MKSRFTIRVAIAAACFSACAYALSVQAAATPDRYMCATVEALDCEPGAACFRGRPADMGAPAFMRIDLANKSIGGAQRTTPIVSMEQNGDALLLQGMEIGFGWTLVLDRRQGTMSATLVNNEGAFVLFGSCTPM